jgi:Ribonuclease G/E
MIRSRQAVLVHVVKKDIGTKGAQKRPFIAPTQEKGKR